MKIEEFRIVENGKGFSIQRLFEIDKPVFKWYLPFPKYVKTKQWCEITSSGNSVNIHSIRFVMPYFKTKDEAIEIIAKLCKEPVYHYPPFDKEASE